MVLEFIVIGAAIVLAVVVARRDRQKTKRWLETLLAFRTIILGAFLLVFALVLIFTGIIWLILLGFVLLFLIFLFLVIVRDDGDMRSSSQVIREWL
jgi:Na+/pantothenate symporter